MTRTPSRRHAGAAVEGARPPLSPRGLPLGTFHMVEVDAEGYPVREVPVRVEGWPYFATALAWA